MEYLVGTMQFIGSSFFGPTHLPDLLVTAKKDSPPSDTTAPFHPFWRELKSSLMHAGIAKVGAEELGLAEKGAADVGLAEVGFAEIGAADVGLPETGLTDVGLVVDGAAVTGADVTGAEVTGADVTGAEVTGAGVTGAEVKGADVTGAEVTGADVTGAEVTGADVIGALVGDLVVKEQEPVVMVQVLLLQLALEVQLAPALVPPAHMPQSESLVLRV
jgi:hypothetical protein